MTILDTLKKSSHQLKETVQKTGRMAALAGSIAVGAAGAEARAETTPEQGTSKPSIASIQHITPKRNVAPPVVPDVMYTVKALDLMDKSGQPTFTQDDIAKAVADQQSEPSSKTIAVDTDVYTDYEKGIINDTAQYLKEKNPASKITQQEITDRLYQVLQVSGNPSIAYTKDDNAWTASMLEHGESNFSPGLMRSSIYINNVSDLIPELAHAYRQENNLMGETGHFITDGLTDILTFSSAGFSKDAQQKNYKKVGQMEHDAHSIVEPVLEQYIAPQNFSIYGNLDSLDKVAATIDILRHQLDSYSATYMWTGKGSDMVERGKAALRSEWLAKLAPSKQTQVEPTSHASTSPSDSKTAVKTDNTSGQLSPAAVAYVQNNRSQR